jgi:RNA-directed DNA polymerase
VISPLLLNVALHGMEHAAGVRYEARERTGRTSPVLTRYADDQVALCHSREQAEQVQDRLGEWLALRGLSFNVDKTQIVHLSQGFDFLGFNIRRYHTRWGGKLLIKPSKDAVTSIRQRLAAEMRSLRGADPAMIVWRLNPIIRGWAAYYRGVVSSKIFHKLDDYMWRLLYRWVRRRHPIKPWYWIAPRYFGRFNTSRRDRWVFGDRHSGAYLHKFAWTPIVRHTLVKHRASPDDPALTDYWQSRRRRRKPPPLAPSTARQIRDQGGCCPLCGELLLHAKREPESPHEWERWFTMIRIAMIRQVILTRTGSQTDERYRLVHAHCARRHQSDRQPGPAHTQLPERPLRPA